MPPCIRRVFGSEDPLWSKFVPLYTESFEGYEADPLEVYEKAIASGESELFLFVEKDEVVGFYILDVHSNFYMLNHIAVARERRGRGLGGLMLESLKNYARGGGRFLVAEASDDLLPFYAKYGFSRIVMDYYVPSFSDGSPIGYNLLLWFPGKTDCSVTKTWLKNLLVAIYHISYYLKADDSVVQKTLSSIPDQVVVQPLITSKKTNQVIKSMVKLCIT